MPRKSVKFDLDFSVKDILPKFKVKQFDDVVLNITTFNNKETYNVGNFKAVIYIACDNDVFMQNDNISVSGNNITINLNRNMLKNHGKAIGEIELTDTAGTITCINFIFDIEGKIGEGASIPGEFEGFVEKYERLILEFKSQVDLCTKNANNLVNETVKKCNTNIDNKLNAVDGLISAKITSIEERFNALTASKQQDAEVVIARDREVSLNARLERDLANTNRELEKIKKLEESAVSTITSNKAFTTVAETTQGYFEDMKIEGKTLVNLYENKAKSYNESYIYSSLEELDLSLLKTNTEYTVFVFGCDRINSCSLCGINGQNVLFTAKRGRVFTFNTPSDLSIFTEAIRFFAYPADSGRFVQGDEKDIKFILLEGDHTDKDISYFERLKSVGQDTDEISVLSTNSDNTETNKKQILYYNPNTQTWEKPILREWDSIEKHSDGKYYYHKRSEEVALNGSESWLLNTATPNQTNTKAFYCNVLQDFTPRGELPKLICDKFNISTSIYFDANDEVIMSQGTTALYSLMVRHTSSNVTDFKAWLQANPVTVVYQLAQEEIYECTNLDLITYQNETNLIVSSGAIQPKITLKVLSNVSNVVKLLQEKVSVLENKFINGLKQVLAGDMMSLAHMLYPEDFEQDKSEVKTLEEL